MATRPASGFTLIELLVAASLACLVLAGSWGWLWTSAASARADERSAEGLSSSAFAARMLRADLRRALRLATPAEGICSDTRLTLVSVDAARGSRGIVTFAWDPSRGVVWRNASGSYLAEHVTRFAVCFSDGRGRQVVGAAGGVLDATAREDVRLISIEMTVADGAEKRDVTVAETVAAKGAP
jgi:prepilin-type N-terminal cleavage/methylation domain-containing protein